MHGIQKILDDYGFSTSLDFLEEYGLESVVPGVCRQCGYTADYEPDQTKGWCEECRIPTVVSGLILLGII